MREVLLELLTDRGRGVLPLRDLRLHAHAGEPVYLVVPSEALRAGLPVGIDAAIAVTGGLYEPAALAFGARRKVYTLQLEVLGNPGRGLLVGYRLGAIDGQRAHGDMPSGETGQLCVMPEESERPRASWTNLFWRRALVDR